MSYTKNIRIVSYNNVDRLTSVTGSASESYIFDAVGNRTSSSRRASYTYQANNRLTSTATGAYTYNANGTMMSSFENGKGLWRYNWDHENRLVTAATRKQTIRYRYDALGRRISRYIAGGKENTKFTYDGNDVVLDDNFGVITKYQNGLGIDNKLKMVTNGVSKYFLQDHLGSTTALTNSSGSVIESATYDSFGNATGNLTTRYQFTGREYDNAIGLTYYRARWYSSELGRFVSEDPIGFAGGDVNLFGYVKNRPLKYKDPKGLDDSDRIFEERSNPRPPDRNPWYYSHNESADNPQIEGSCGCFNPPGGTLQIGLGGTGVIGILGGFGPAGQLGAGVALDVSGNVIGYSEYGLGAGIGAGIGGGVSVNGSNANTVYDLAGRFKNIGVGAGSGADLAFNGFTGNNNDGSSIIGGGFTIGAGAGAGGSITGTNTNLHGGFNIFDALGVNLCKRNF